MVAIVAMLPQYTVAQNVKMHSVMGNVTNEQTDEPLTGVVLQLVETKTKATTNEAGEYIFMGTQSGKYTLRAILLGYETLETTIEVSADEAVTRCDLKMQPKNYDMNEVVVSANRNEVKRSMAPVVVSVLNQKMFETVNSPDLAKSLNFQSGLRVENNCQNCAFPQVRINGLEGPYSQILINSRPVVSALSGVYGLEQIPVNMIERVEVVRGGGSALFGANAVGGTINIITKTPTSNSFAVNTQVSNMNGKAWEETMGADVSLVSKDRDYGIALYESFRNRNPYAHNLYYALLRLFSLFPA